jgi:hypothetical protein
MAFFMRKINIDLSNYSKIINPNILIRVANQTHPMAAMPYYKSTTVDKLYEEQLIEDRFKELCDSYSRSLNTPVDKINPESVFFNGGKFQFAAINHETKIRSELVILAEKIVREQFNLGTDEVLFDLEIVDIGECSLPEEVNKEKKVPDDFEQTTDKDILKKRTINALSQGAAKKSNYLFHLYRDSFDKLNSKLCDNFQKGLISNDLMYYLFNDDQFAHILCSSDINNGGYCKINFNGDVPCIEVKAVTTPLLIHESIKAIITLLSISGIQNMSQESIDDTDYVMAELWEIRFGPTLWTEFHSLIDVDDYDIKKLIIKSIFEKETDDFLSFFDDVLNNQEVAKNEIKRLVKIFRKDILDYQFNGEF